MHLLLVNEELLSSTISFRCNSDTFPLISHWHCSQSVTEPFVIIRPSVDGWVAVSLKEWEEEDSSDDNE